MVMRVVKTAEERKNEILDVAEQLFAEKGFDNASTNDIINKIGIARGTLYHHFASKEEILEKSNWSEEEVSLLFADRRFPMTEVARKQVVEVHALIQFFARKEVIKIKQLEDRAQMDLIFAHLKK